MQRWWYVVLRWPALVGLLWVVLGCAGARQPTAVQNGAGPGVPKQLQTRQVIVTLAPAPPEHWANVAQALAQTYGLPLVGTFPLTSIGVQCIVYQVPTDRPVDEILLRLAADPRVESVQPNHVFEGLVTVHNDPYATLQHGAQAIRADLAHHLATGKGVRVAVIDTGVDTEHPDLQGRVVRTANFVEGGEDTFTQDNHGTAVAGVIAARADNAIGIFGVAPEADLVAVKACWHRAPGVRAATCSSWTLAKAVDFVMLVPVQVLNMSLAGPPDPLLARLITAAVQRGTTVIAAVLEAGHEAPGFPAALETVIAVRVGDAPRPAPLLLEDQRPPPLAAPGVDVLTTVPGQTYDFFSGSSLATAHVSGIVALLLERQPQLTPAQIHAILRATVQPVRVASDTSSTPAPLVDACRALGELLGSPACP
jgi:subtilisin family serine protease